MRKRGQKNFSFPKAAFPLIFYVNPAQPQVEYAHHKQGITYALGALHSGSLASYPTAKPDAFKNPSFFLSLHSLGIS